MSAPWLAEPLALAVKTNFESWAKAKCDESRPTFRMSALLAGWEATDHAPENPGDDPRTEDLPLRAPSAVSGPLKQDLVGVENHA